MLPNVQSYDFVIDFFHSGGVGKMKEHRGSVVDGEGKKKDQWGTDVVSEGEKTDQSGEINVAKGRRAAFEYTPTLFVYLIVRFIRSDFI